MFILTDGKNYVMRNPVNPSKYMPTTSSALAEQFTFKQARNLKNNKRKSDKWINGYYALNVDTGQKENTNGKSNDKVFCGTKDIEFDEKILDDIMTEANSLLGIAGWNSIQLSTYKNILSGALSKYDSAESDINHALEKYKEDNDGKKPQAHKIAKIGYLLDDIRDKHKKIKQCIAYINVMQDAITYKYSLEKIKEEISKVKYVEYKGRTEYYKIALDILN